MEMDAEIIDYPTNGGRRGPSLPHAVDAERALLGAFMVNNEVLDNVSAFLKEEFFYDKRHKLTFSTMLRLFENGAFDPVLLAERLGAETICRLSAVRNTSPSWPPLAVRRSTPPPTPRWCV